MEKTCNICGENKPLTEFNKHSGQKDGLQTKCRSCDQKIARQNYHLKYKKQQIAGNKRRRLEKKAWLQEYKKTLCCSKCGEKRWYVLDFHHKDKEHKENSIACLLSNNRTIKDIQKEIGKCEVLCANCHREFHYLERVVS